MKRMCSLNRCTRTATRILTFDADYGGETINIRADAYACDQHRDQIAADVHAYGDTDSDLLDAGDPA